MRPLKDPLFSIACVTYNQEDLVTECLDSIARQDYGPIELVVCDDASTDGTVQVVEEWIAARGARFKNVVVLKNLENMGISGAHDRALRKTSGKWVKYIAGDDILSKDCASQIVSFSELNDINWGQTLVRPFIDHLKETLSLTLPLSKHHKYFHYPSEQQFRMLCRGCFLSAPGNFFLRSILVDIDFLDTDFKRFEDWHTWLRLSKSGFRCSLLKKPLVFWRRHLRSISYSPIETADFSFFCEKTLTLNKYIIPFLEDLDWITRLHVLNYKKYLEAFMKNGSDWEAHKKARIIFLADPTWWLNLDDFLIRIIQKHRY